MKKNIYLFITSILFFLILTEIGIRYLISIKKDFLFKSYNHLNFYKKYVNHLNHLRDTIIHPNDPKEYLFNYVNKLDDQNKTILFQGDSRSEQINNLDSKFFSNFNFNIISGGTSSFSPSHMSVQLDLLVNDFNIRPNIIVTLIDPTDLGDEMCRYKDKVVFENNKIKKIKKSELKGDFYFYNNIFLLSEINLTNNPKFLYLPKLINHFFKYNLKSVSNCRYDEIQKYLINKDKKAENYFNLILNKYLNNINSYPFIEEVYFVFYPHIQHLDKNAYGTKYNIKLSDVVDQNKLKNVNIINFYEKDIFKEFNENYFEIFIENDHASHLTKVGENIFFKKIFNEILN